jgi:hypothetical protein
VTLASDLIKIEKCRAVGPIIAFSLSGSYDRLNDDLKVSGMSVQISSIISNRKRRGALTAEYNITGSLGTGMLSVGPLRYAENDELINEFGNSLPTFDVSSNVRPQNSYVGDPFGQNAFDHEDDSAVDDDDDSEDDEELPKPAPKKMEKRKEIKKKTIDKKFGVTINRGLHR